MEKSKALEQKRNGQCAVYIVPDGDNVVGLVAIYGGIHDNADIKAMIDLDDSLSDLIEYATCFTKKECDCPAETGCSCSAKKGCKYDKLKDMSQYTHRKETVYVYRQLQCGMPENWQDYHMCACRGNIIMATSQDLAKGAIDNILDNKTRIALEGKCRLQTSINTAQIAGDILSWEKDFAEWCNISDMKPIKIYSTTSSNGKHTLYIAFDNVSVREFGKLIFAVLGTVASPDSEAETPADNGSDKKVEQN
jgi:hypothetical protein